MQLWYVSNLRGSDSTGTGSAVAPWKTIGKAIGASPGIVPNGTGDTLYVEPGVYHEAVSLALTPSAASPLSIVADVSGAGFAQGGYTSLLTGAVEWRAWTDPYTILSAACLAASAKPYVTLQNLKMLGGNSSPASCVAVSGASAGWNFLNCQFIAGVGSQGVSYSPGDGASGAWNLLVDGCIFVGGAAANLVLYSQLGATEYNLNAVVRNSLFTGRSNGVTIQTTSGGTGTTALGTGLLIQNCSILGMNAGIAIYTANAITMTTPIQVAGCILDRVQTGITTNNTSMVADLGNVINAVTPYSSVTPGGNTKTTVAPSFDLNDGFMWGYKPRPFGTPRAAGVFGGWGSYGTPSTKDLLGRQRPSGYLSILPAAGAFELHDEAASDATHADSATSSPACLMLQGPKDFTWLVEVGALVTNLAAKVCWDGNHGDATKPWAEILANPEIGVAAQTVTATTAGGTGATPNAYETLTFAPFTPTKAGVVKLRFHSAPAASNGIAYFDTVTS